MPTVRTTDEGAGRAVQDDGLPAPARHNPAPIPVCCTEPQDHWTQHVPAVQAAGEDDGLPPDRLAEAIELAFEEGWIQSDYPLADVIDVIAAKVGAAPPLHDDPSGDESDER